MKLNLVDITIINRLSSFDMNFLIWYFQAGHGHHACVRHHQCEKFQQCDQLVEEHRRACSRRCCSDSHWKQGDGLMRNNVMHENVQKQDHLK